MFMTNPMDPNGPDEVETCACAADVPRSAGDCIALARGWVKVYHGESMPRWQCEECWNRDVERERAEGKLG